jgi:hypothetical protein
MWDSDMFAIQDPEGGAIGYCCVMGRIREHFALVVYLGSEGLAGYLQMQRGQAPASPIEVMMLQSCLMASYEDRDMLDASERQTIKELGLKFRGRNAWPQLLSYRPGYYPSPCNRDETRFLTVALEQAIEVCLRFRDNPALLTPPRRGLYFGRVSTGSGDALKWEDTWLKPPPVEQSEPVPPPVDEARLERLRGTARRTGSVWEIDLGYCPTRITGEGGRPYYPYAALCVERETVVVMGVEMLHPAKFIEGFGGAVLQIMERAAEIPAEIHVKREDAGALLQPIAFALGIRLRVLPGLGAAEALRADLFEYLQR